VHYKAGSQRIRPGVSVLVASRRQGISGPYADLFAASTNTTLSRLETASIQVI
jgi:hypothetical protein